jgi:archaellum biogenesis ATPase FlaH
MLISLLDMDSLLERLPYATDAPFNARKWQHAPNCLPDTRVDLLQQIHDWIDSNDEIDRTDERSIFWLNGWAGTGKSTISRTIAYDCFQQGCLGASFFFSKGGGDISHAGQFFTTIARQLAEESQYLKRCIYDAMKENKTIATQSYANQWRQLILGPLSKLDRGYRAFSFVLVIDALDECENDDDIKLILRLLAEAQSLKKVRIRVFLTSRPETPIRTGFNQISEESHRHIVLHNISIPVINRDISIFLTYNLRLIGQKEGWPGEAVISQLVKNACGLFIWAATACLFIKNGILRRIIESRLTTILETSSSVAESLGPEKHLDQIYITVLRQSISADYSDPEKQEFLKLLKETLGSIVILLLPLSIYSLSRLLDIDAEDISDSLKDLHAIMDISKDKSQPVRLHHPSFRDFLLNQNRCVDLNFWVNKKLAHQKLMEYCIQLMSTSLEKDICNAITPGIFTTEIERSKVDQALPPELQYACLYWTQHLQKSGAYLQDNERVHQFLQNHFLHWLEALGWMQKISEGITQIINLEATAAVSNIMYLRVSTEVYFF